MLIYDAGKIDLNRYIEEMRQSGSRKRINFLETQCSIPCSISRSFDTLFDIPYCYNGIAQIVRIPLALIGLHCRCKLCQRFFILYQNIIPFTAVLSFDISSKRIKVVATMMIKNRLTEDTFCVLHFGRRYPWCHRTFI